jgi:glucose-6-phosphate dehydrogenase assembly protein OpcA
MARRRPVVDLSWFRLRPWREVLASLFEGGSRPFVHGVETAEVRGKAGPRRLLAGWLADRLQLPRRAFHIVDADHAAIRLVARADGHRGEFSVVRRGDERALVATVEIEPLAAHRSLRLLPDADVAWGLQDALTSLPGDPMYAGALRAAADLQL